MAEVKRARNGYEPSAVAAASASDAVETRLALAEYHPFWRVEQIPQTTAVLFVIADKESLLKNESHAIAASKLLKGATDVISVSATHTSINAGAAFEKAADAAADWFLKHL
jgi:hypothetical protein